MAFFSAVHPGFVAPRGCEALDDGVIRVAAGPAGCVLWGPHVAAEAGVYRATSRTHAEGGESPVPLYWDVYADGSVYGGREFRGGSSLVVRLPDTTALEFRLTTDGVALTHAGVELEPLMLDRDAPSVAQLEAVMEAVLAEEGWPDALFHLIERLAKLAGAARAEAWRQRFLARGDRTRAKLESVWTELNTPGLRAISTSFDFELDHEGVARWAEANPAQRLDVSPQNGRALTGADAAALRRHGYEPDFVHATGEHRSLRTPRRPWQEGPGPDGAAAISPLPPVVEALRNVDISFQAEVARGEPMLAYCPVSGRLLRSTHAFGHHIMGCVQTFYRFEGVEVFYLCTGDYHNSRMFLFMPATNTFILIQEQILRWYPYREIIREFVIKMILHRYDVIAYLNAPARRAAVLGINNIGHFFWNDIAGLQYAVENDLCNDVDMIVTTPIQYIDHRKVFPELAQIPTRHVEEPSDVFGYLVRNRLTPVHFTDAQISPALFDRLRRVAHAYATPAGSPRADGPRPLLWLNLRANNKVWIGQAEGYASILNAIHDEYGGAAALLQGVPDCIDLVTRIRELCHPDIELYDGINIDIYDKINFAGMVDAYICVAGAGLAFTTWLADQHGVAHAEHAHLDHLPWWPYARPEAPHPLAPQKAEVVEIGTGWWCDYELDWRVLLDLLRQALAARAADPRRPPLPKRRVIA